MAQLIYDLDVHKVRANVDEARERIDVAAALAGRAPGDVQLLAAVKYVPLESVAILAEAGLTLLGENRAQDLEAKAAAYPNRFTWDFIGHLQSRKVKQILPFTRLIHSVSSDSVLEQLARHASGSDVEVLIEVNVAGEASKSGVAPDELAAFVARCPVPVVGLMTMPPLARRAEGNRRHFAALRELAERHGLRELSMGTSQDYEVAVEEGATIVRLGSTLYV
ncbi:YggS family pyridoxal phosphate enzyme [Conexibacter sp. JD483]|uniref:YggS family pyridoxal phosphate enzyme n=1 Tax=unclassified Conexibacter TaxID=2627773 RepID=UPI002720A782|nr:MULTISPECIES: YggS family pyridoxal phosphate enzyme [unclassified Conexibacter]MDO8189559.1 YggS family pyridoxal phosphate enzyme [Conexibacter sp. CPCC 205706]MDO8201153.1 YggS family pyridoxal phosphate enzyme [Conexibacter sp. CPCC 205762]MDR9372947.1 YggS family pyridoxal phosphate enzyme [Conexibacter sp. JD483]